MVCWMDSDGAARSRARSTRSSTPPARCGRWSRTCATGSTSTRCTATPTPTELALNEIGRVTLRATAPLFADDYRRNRATGSFILIDEATQPDRRRRRCSADRRRLTRRADRPNVVWHDADGRPRRPLAAPRLPGRRCGSPGCRGRASRRVADAVAERAARRSAARPTCSTATTCATGSTPTSGSRPPTGPRTSAASARSPG